MTPTPQPNKCKTCRVNWKRCDLQLQDCKKIFPISDPELELILQINENLPTDELEIVVRDLIVMDIRDRHPVIESNVRSNPLSKHDAEIARKEIMPMTDFVISEEQLEGIMDNAEADKHYKNIHSRPLSSELERHNANVIKELEQRVFDIESIAEDGYSARAEGIKIAIALIKGSKS